MYELSIKIKNYKCFKEETGFDCIRRVNLIVGKNNSGKSSLLDLIEIAAANNYRIEKLTRRDNEDTQLLFESIISETVVNQVFSPNLSGGHIRGNHRSYGQEYIGRKIKWAKGIDNTNNINNINDINRSTLINCDDKGIDPPLQMTGDYEQKLINNMPIPLKGKKFRRLQAERDILPEVAQSGNIEIGNNASGLTNAVQNFINSSNLPRELIKINMLEALNSIFAHDTVFTDIVCQLHDNEYWEIYLEEKHKGCIALSQSGSGLKTVISVLACLILVPDIEKTPLSQYIFAFEEMENNIHPALLRRLNDYIYQEAKKNEFLYFITTHSNVLIDQFSKEKDAQIIHVKHKDSVSTCTTAITYIDSNGILDDLDVRASDLLQANGIIWVEGPSDRIYLNKWINLWSNNDLKEGTHYQIIFYGGRLLSHISAKSPEDVESGISILNANRNAIILIDSDKKKKQTPINDTKKRIKEEFETMGAHCWITAGKEIENYIPSAVVDALLTVTDSKQVDKYESFFNYLDSITKGEGAKYNSKKPLLAEKIIPYMTKDNLSDVLDINENMEQICASIREWNS